jgi:hypothetical protein
MRRLRHRPHPKLSKMLREMLPRITLADFKAIEEIAERGHLRHLPPGIIAWQAITTHVRHNHTEYDQLLEEGYDSDSARHFVLETMNEKLAKWGCLRRIEENETD